MESTVEKEKGKNISELICPVCDKKFIKKHTFERHKKLNNCSKKCLVCGKTFSHAKSARAHALQVHSLARDKQCDRCDKTFKVSVHVMRHINRVHLKIRNFPCEICQHRFFTSQALASHVDAVHKKLKNFPCSCCTKTFCRKANRDDHEECVHDKNKFYKCKICKVRCARQQTLKRHMKMFHQQSDVSWKYDWCGFWAQTCFGWQHNWWISSKISIAEVKHFLLSLFWLYWTSFVQFIFLISIRFYVNKTSCTFCVMLNLKWSNLLVNITNCRTTSTEMTVHQITWNCSWGGHYIKN